MLHMNKNALNKYSRRFLNKYGKRFLHGNQMSSVESPSLKQHIGKSITVTVTVPAIPAHQPECQGFYFRMRKGKQCARNAPPFPTNFV